MATGITNSDVAATIHLRSGNYTLTSSAPGFAKKSLEVHLPLNAPLSIKMDLSSVTDIVNVSGDSGCVPYDRMLDRRPMRCS